MTRSATGTVPQPDGRRAVAPLHAPPDRTRRTHAGVLERRALAALASTVALASVSGTLLFCYSATIGAARRAVELIHELSGDAALLASGVYLCAHLPRVWALRRCRVSGWSGFVVVGVWLAAAGSGVYGQIAPLRSGSALWHLHVWSSLVAVAAACFHGVWAFRPRGAAPNTANAARRPGRVPPDRRLKKCGPAALGRDKM